MNYLIIQSLFLLQDLSKPDLLQILSFRDLSAGGILIAVIIYFYRRTNSLETKVDEYIKQKDVDNQRYYELTLKINEVLSETNRQTNETNKILQKIQTFLDRTQN